MLIRPDETSVTNMNRCGRENVSSFKPLDLLPDEVLTEILEAVIQEHLQCRPDWQPPHWPQNTSNLFRLMFLDRRLRRACIEYHSIWSIIHVDVHNQDWYDLCIARAGTHPLDVRGCLPLNDWPGVQAVSRMLALMNQSRYIRLVICPRPGDDHEIDQQQSSKAFAITLELEKALFDHPNPPCLQIYHLFHQLQPLGTGLRLLGGDPVKSNDFTFPHLTELLISHFSIEDLPYLPALRTLTLERIRFDDRCHNLRTILSRTPNVVVLALRDIPFDPLRDVRELLEAARTIMEEGPRDVIRLSSLSTLCVSGDRIEVARVMLILPDPCHELRIAGSENLIDGYCYPKMRSQLEDCLCHCLHTRIASFMCSAFENRILHSHGLRLRSIYNGTFEASRLTGFSLERHFSRHFPFSPADGQILNIDWDFVMGHRHSSSTEWVQNLHHYVCHVKLHADAILMYMELLDGANHVDSLVILEVDFAISSSQHIGETLNTSGSDGDGDETISSQATLESLLSLMISLHQLELRYMAYMAHLLPSMGDRLDVQTRWKESGWVKEVIWTLIEDNE